MPKHRTPLAMGLSWSGLLTAMALLAGNAATYAEPTPAIGSQPDALVEGSRAAAVWDMVGVSSARSEITSDAGALRAVLAAGDQASFMKRVAVDPGTAFRLVFDLSLSDVPARSQVAQTIRVGSNLHQDDVEAGTYARLSLVGSESGFRVVDPASGRESAAFTGTQAVTWAVNESGSAIDYTAPDGTTEVVGSHRVDAWVGRTQVVDEALSTPGRGISELKWSWSEGSGVTTVDEFTVLPLKLEPSRVVPGALAVAAEAIASGSGSAEAEEELALYEPSPNPFQNTIRLAYAISASSESVDIGVFDLSGRRVRSLIQGTQPAGRYEVTWDGRTQGGSQAGHGVYFMRANIGSESRVARIVYLFR